MLSNHLVLLQWRIHHCLLLTRQGDGGKQVLNWTRLPRREALSRSRQNGKKFPCRSLAVPNRLGGAELRMWVLLQAVAGGGKLDHSLYGAPRTHILA